MYQTFSHPNCDPEVFCHQDLSEKLRWISLVGQILYLLFTIDTFCTSYICHGCDQVLDRMSLGGGRIYFGMWFEGTSC